MTGHELKAIRKRLGLSAVEMGRAFGYDGSEASTRMAIHRFESGGRNIPPWLGRLAQMYDKHGIPAGWTNGPPSTTTKNGDDK